MEVLKRLFEQHYRFQPEQVHALQGQLGGSGRAIVRLAGQGISAIGILYSVREENIAFLEFSKHFRRHGLPVPEIYKEDLDEGAYLEEDLGDSTLYEFLVQNRSEGAVALPALEAYRRVVAVLPRFQVEAGRNLNYKVCYPRASFDRQSIAWDLNYFKYYFLRLAGISFNEQALEHDFGRLTKFLLSADRDYFLYRDFQSRNIMLRDGQPFFLDYQGGRKGALQYDIASLLYDGKADLPPEMRQSLLDYYLECLGDYVNVNREAFMEHFYAYVYVRIMQAMGAYGFRGFYERKSHFLQSVPYALKNLRWLAHNVKLSIDVPALLDAFHSMLASEKLQGLASSAEPLKVRIFSFSFHRQIPADELGNGGGYIFDARSLPNPGREEQFRALTGKDEPVIAYLNQQVSVHQYLANVLALVDGSVAEYQRRGFKNLMVSFGCTGGQHRSVFLAEQLAKHVRAASGVEVVVRFHVDHDALATLAVQNRETSRYLLFDEHGELCGRRAVHNENLERSEPEMARPAGQVLPLAFSGIHVISPRVLSRMEENGAFSIITTYLHLVAQGARIIAFRADNSYWRDLGRPEHIAQAAQDLRFGVLCNLI